MPSTWPGSQPTRYDRAFDAAAGAPSDQGIIGAGRNRRQHCRQPQQPAGDSKRAAPGGRHGAGAVRRR
ncbi:hypothetical protein CBM2623_A150069 [Cupriavidus taiwanensis]|nr:hypothetical protein CBM2608_A150069 [Cupriavidus taiwanensis]SPA25820.1 hypothetical protein CBM2623_A150069 [Cupriavidus taiwanensis]